MTLTLKLQLQRFDVYATRKDETIVQLADGLVSHEAAILMLEHAWSLVGDTLPYRNAWMKSGSDRTRRAHRLFAQRVARERAAAIRAARLRG